MNIEFIFRPIERWPQEVTRTRKRASFRKTYSQQLDLLSYELGRLGARKTFIQADITERDIRLDGQLRKLQAAVAILRHHHGEGRS